MAKAAELRGEKRQVIAVIGDGAMTGGLAFEGMNNAGASRKTNMLVVLNDNNMAIDQATGALKATCCTSPRRSGTMRSRTGCGAGSPTCRRC